MKKALFFCHCGLCCFGIACSNDYQCQGGTVKDALTNEELIGGVTVLVVETGAGTVTGVNGNFELDVPVNNTLRISYVGYSIQEIVITNQTFLEINLQPETQLIDELVVVGYSVQKKVDSYRGGSTCQR